MWWSIFLPEISGVDIFTLFLFFCILKGMVDGLIIGRINASRFLILSKKKKKEENKVTKWIRQKLRGFYVERRERGMKLTIKLSTIENWLGMEKGQVRPDPLECLSDITLVLHRSTRQRWNICRYPIERNTREEGGFIEYLIDICAMNFLMPFIYQIINYLTLFVPRKISYR